MPMYLRGDRQSERETRYLCGDVEQRQVDALQPVVADVQRRQLRRVLQQVRRDARHLVVGEIHVLDAIEAEEAVVRQARQPVLGQVQLAQVAQVLEDGDRK